MKNITKSILLACTFAALQITPARAGDSPQYRVFALDASYSALRTAFVAADAQKAKLWGATYYAPDGLSVLAPGDLVMLLQGASAPTAKELSTQTSPIQITSSESHGLVDLTILSPASGAKPAKRSITLHPQSSLLVAVPDQTRPDGFRLFIVSPRDI